MALTPSARMAQDGGVAPRSVVIVAYPGVQVLDIAGPNEVFAGANALLVDRGLPPAYAMRVVSAGGELVRTEGGLALDTLSLPGRSSRIDTLVLPGGNGVHDARRDLR